MIEIGQNLSASNGPLRMPVSTGPPGSSTFTVTSVPASSAAQTRDAVSTNDLAPP